MIKHTKTLIKLPTSAIEKRRRLKSHMGNVFKHLPGLASEMGFNIDYMLSRQPLKIIYKCDDDFRTQNGVVLLTKSHYENQKKLFKVKSQNVIRATKNLRHIDERIEIWK